MRGPLLRRDVGNRSPLPRIPCGTCVKTRTDPRFPLPPVESVKTSYPRNLHRVGNEGRKRGLASAILRLSGTFKVRSYIMPWLPGRRVNPSRENELQGSPGKEWVTNVSVLDYLRGVPNGPRIGHSRW